MQKLNMDSQEAIGVRSIVEGCIQNTPVIILGSGASAGFGVHTMESLATELISKVGASQAAKTHQNHWNLFLAAMQETSNLERSLEKIENSAELIAEISDTAWTLICEKDKDLFRRLIEGELQLPMSGLIQKLSNGIGTSKSLKIVTTNYDRLAEYACDFINDEYSEYLHYTGFSYGLIRKPDEQFNTASANMGRRVLQRSDAGYLSKIKPVEILKVHGSIDWFEADDGSIFSLPFYDMKPKNARPAIITPGKLKFERTHSRPYSTIIERARHVLDSTNYYLIIGFGFRDNHIHNNLEKKIKAQHGNKSFVVLTKELTEETKYLFLKNKGADHFLLLESDGASGTVIHKKDRNSEYVEYHLEGACLWKLDEFNKFFLQGR